MKKFLIPLALILFTLVLACKENTTQKSGSTLSGQVVDLTTGQPLTDAQICIQNTDQCTKVDNNGNYKLDQIEASREHVFEISAPGYITAIQTIGIGENDNVIQAFALTEENPISQNDLTGGGIDQMENINEAVSDKPDDGKSTTTPQQEEEKKEETSPDRSVYKVVEVMPELIGGIDALQNKIIYPQAGKAAGIEGMVVLEFIVEKDGAISNPKVVKSIGYGCDEEALRLLSLAKFKPGKHRGEVVRVKKNLPIKFKLNP